MPTAQQLSLPFACLDFPDRDSVSVGEIAGKLGVTTQHVIDHVVEGRLLAINTALAESRTNLRIAVDEYRRWVLSMLTAPARRAFLQELPRATLRELQAEIHTLLGESAA